MFCYFPHPGFFLTISMTEFFLWESFLLRPAVQLARGLVEGGHAFAQLLSLDLM
jgi:hypothetical protein